MVKVGVVRRLTAIVANLSLLLNSFLPFLLISKPTYAQSSEIVVSNITYDTSASKLNITTNSTEKIAYQLFYKTPEKIDAIVGNDLNQSNQNDSFYLGTCSANSVCLSQNISRGVLKIESNSKFYSKLFTFENNVLTIVKEIESTQTDLTEEEDNFLENGGVTNPTLWTFKKVELNKEYVAPQNSGVKITFTKLPETSGNIKIEEITLTPEQIEQTGSLSDKAYDITSDMVDGTFAYNLSLPIPESSINETVEIKYAEDIFNLDSAQKVDKTITNTDTSVSVNNLDHFTVFVVTSPPYNGNITGFVGATGLTVLGNTAGDFNTTISGILTEYSNPGQRVSFSGTISGNIVGNISGGVNYNGADTLFAEITGSGASGYVYLIGIFSGENGHFVGKFVNQPNPINFTTEITIDGGNSVSIGNTLQLSATTNGDSQEVAWAVYVNDSSKASINQTTGLLTAINVGSVTVIASALDGSLVTKNHTVTITPDVTAPPIPTGLKFQSTDRTKDFICRSFLQLQPVTPDWDDITNDSTFSHYEYTSFLPNGTFGLNEKVLTSSEFPNTWMPPADGAYGYAVRSVDFAGNKSDWSLSSKTLAGSCQIIYDNTAPSKPTFTSPTINITNINAITLKWDGGDDTGSGVKGYIFRYVFNPTNGGSPVNWSSGFVNTTAKTRSGSFGHGQGTYMMYIKTVDNVGNESLESDALTITYDATAPLVANVNVVEKDTWNDYSPYIKGNTTFRIRADVSDIGSGLNTATCEYSFDNGINWSAGLFNSGTNRCIADISPTIADSTAYMINVRVADIAGNMGEGTAVGYTVDSATPTTNSITISPDTGTHTNVAPTITGIITDSVSPITQCQYRYKTTGSAWPTFANNGTWDGTNCTATISGLIDGQSYDFSMRGLDSVGHYGGGLQNNITRIVDATTPTVASVSSDGQTYNLASSSPQRITITFNEDMSTSPTIEVHTTVVGYYVNDCSDGDAKTFCFDYTINAGEELVHTIYISGATDTVGNVMTADNSHTFIVDTLAPNAPTLNSPIDGFITKGVAFTQNWYSVVGAVLYEYESCNVDPGNVGGICSNKKYSSTYTGTNKNVGAGQPNSHFWWRVRAKDTAGNWGGWSESRELTIDNTAPNITLNSTSYNDPSIGGSLDDSTAIVNVSINGGTYSAIVGTGTWSININSGSLFLPLNGNFPFTVTATDLAGNESVVTGTIIMDNTGPIAPLLTSPVDNAATNINPILSWQTTTDTNGIKNYLLQMSLNSGDWVDTDTNLQTTFDTSIKGLTDGTYHWRVAAYDNAGNGSNFTVAAWQFIKDTVDPTSTIDGGEDNGIVYSNTWDGSITGTATDNLSGVKEVQLTIQNSTNEYWTGLDWQTGETSVIAAGTTNWTYQIGTTLNEGTYTIKSHAVDNANNMENTYTLTIVLDKTISEVGISLNPKDPDASNGWYKTQPEITLTHTDTNFDKIEYQWDSQSNIGWSIYSNPFKLVNEGAHILYYRAVDKASNISPVGIKNIKWDKTEIEFGPQNISANPNPTSGSTSKIKWEFGKDNIGIDKYEVKWKLNGGENSPEYSKTVGAGTTEVEIDQLTEGRWTVRVIAYDASGKSRDNSIDLIVDRTGPSAPNLSLTGTGTGTASLSWNAINDAKDYIIWYGNIPGTYLYGARVGNVTSYTVQGLGAGNYYFVIKSVDEAQNQSGYSNEVNTGNITGAIGTIPGQPAEGFTEDVLGDDTENETTSPTPTLSSGGEVLGESGDNLFNWRWLLLLLLIPTYLIGRRYYKEE